jgi:hypothetical protein
VLEDRRPTVPGAARAVQQQHDRSIRAQVGTAPSGPLCAPRAPGECHQTGREPAIDMTLPSV